MYAKYIRENLLFSRNALTERGVIVVKENVTSSGHSEVDTTDSSVTRTLKQFLRIFKAAKLKRMKQCKQTNFPNGIYPVYMFALVPSSEVEANDNHNVDSSLAITNRDHNVD